MEKSRSKVAKVPQSAKVEAKRSPEREVIKAHGDMIDIRSQ